MSVKELTYKLLSKGVEKNHLEDYISSHKEELAEFELSSAKNIIIKKRNSMENDLIEDYLFKKGYLSDIIKLAFEELQ